MCSNSPNSPFCQRRKGLLLRRLIKKASDLASTIDNRLTAADRGSEVSDWIVDLSNERIGPSSAFKMRKTAPRSSSRSKIPCWISQARPARSR